MTGRIKSSGRRLLLLLAGVSLFVGCELINPPEEIPAFMEIDNFELTTRGGEGSNSHKITDAWVYVNGEFLGAFPLPATVPVLWSGDAELFIDPGIKENGIESTPNIYPYYQRFMSSINLTPGETIQIEPTTRYKTNIDIPYLEPFDGSLHTLQEGFDEDPNTVVDITDAEVLEGTGSGRIVLTAANPEILVATSSMLRSLPTDGLSPVYLEMDYKNDIPFEVGLRGTTNSGVGGFEFRNGLNIKDNWNKVYLNLTESLRVSQLDQYQIAIRAVYPPEGFDESEAVILLDNLKLVHREQ
ncbi:MAG: hypothetical protein AAFO94_05280 [Bacteroidota bacterium]